MKKFQFSASLLIAVLLLVSPLEVRAVSAPSDPPLQPLAPIIVSELQPRSGLSASEEFIELYNTTSQAIDLAAHNWQIELASTTATDWNSPLRRINLTGTIPPGGTYVVASTYQVEGQTVQYLAETANIWFGAAISSRAGHLRLLYTTYQQQGTVCVQTPTVVDEMEWSAPADGQPETPSLDGRSVYMPFAGGISKVTSLQRWRQPAEQGYVDSDNDAVDFVQAPPTPGSATLQATNILVVTAVAAQLPSDACQPHVPVPTPDPAPSDPPLPLPDHGSGGTTDPGSDPSPSDPGTDPPGQDPDPPLDSEPENPAPPNPNTGLTPPQLTELLPNPAPPLTDGEDEFIELYNPNDVPFDVGGFVLEAGVSVKHRYSFAAGMQLPARSYTVLFSANTGLSLANSGGQVRLLDASQVVLSESAVYAVAPDGQAWALQTGIWQWTTTPTPNTANAIAAPTTAVKTSTTKAPSTPKKAAVKTTATKATTNSKTTAATPKVASTELTPAAARQPLHTGVLAAAGVFAVLYGAYEYRHDMANKIHRLRNYRAARRAHRQSAKGR